MAFEGDDNYQVSGKECIDLTDDGAISDEACPTELTDLVGFDLSNSFFRHIEDALLLTAADDVMSYYNVNAWVDTENALPGSGALFTDESDLMTGSINEE